MKKILAGHALGTTRGAGAVEYGVAVGLIAAVSLVVIAAVGQKLPAVFNRSADMMETARAGVNPNDPYFVILPDGERVPNPSACQVDTEVDDVFGAGGTEIKSPGNCVVFLEGGNDSLAGGETGLTLRVDAPADGTSGVDLVLGGGDDMVHFLGGFGSLDGGGGSDIFYAGALSLGAPTFNLVDGEDVEIETAGYTFTLENVFTTSQLAEIHFSNASLTTAGFAAHLIDLQETTGDDTIAGTDFDDMIEPGTGNDIITGDAGDDRIVYGGGDDTIPSGTGGEGSDILDLGTYLQADIVMAKTGGDADGDTVPDDITITTPDGVITLPLYNFYHSATGIVGVDAIEFSDTTLASPESIRGAAP